MPGEDADLFELAVHRVAVVRIARHRNWLKGADGDALHALLCGAGHNLRMILRHLRVLCLALAAWLMFVARSVIASAGPIARAAAG